MGTESDWYGNEGTIKFETIDRHFANEILNVWYSRFIKQLYNFVFTYSRLFPHVFPFTTMVVAEKGKTS